MLAGDIRFHDAPSTQLLAIGLEQTPVYVADDLLVDLAPILREACASASFLAESRTSYPSIRAELPSAYAQAVFQHSIEVLRSAYKVPEDLEPILKAGYFSLVTRTVEQLSPLQCMPHFDSTKPHYFAVMHYLNPGPFGGTSFYRHRPTQFENITAPRQDRFIHAAQVYLASHGGKPPRRYINGSDGHFELLESVPYQQNRLLIYPGTQLHSGNIDPSRDIDSDPRTGRLTANLFISFE
jgi:hypothetical protein